MYRLALAVAACLVASLSCNMAAKTPQVSDHARRLAQELIIVDGHIDVPYWLDKVYREDISKKTIGGDFDYPRAKRGGLDAPFMSIYVPAEYQEKGGAKAYADSLIDLVESIAAESPDKFAIATSPDEVRRNHEEGLISLPMGIENAAAAESELSNLEHFRQRGVRYVTLVHSKDNLVSDSSYDTTGTWSGLSPFGRDVVREMNRLGIMVDVSHVSDSAFYDVLEVTSVPVIASHSSARTFTPGWERNISDEMIEALAANGGIVMINFGSDFLDSEYDDISTAMRKEVNELLESKGLERSSKKGFRLFSEERRKRPVGSIEDVVKHIRHVVELVGVDHVGLGSDYDGVFALPRGLQDVSTYPNLIDALLADGFSEDDIRKICGENLLRIWSQVERAAENGG